MCKTILNTPQERHAFLIGFCAGFCPWLPKLISHDSPFPPIKGEEHYFAAGVVPGAVALLFFLIGLAKLAMEVLV